MQVASNLVGTVAVTNVWTDFMLNEAQHTPADMPVSVDTNLTVALRLDTNGYVTVYDPAKQVQADFPRNEAPSAGYAIDIYSPVDGRLGKSGTGEGDDQLNISVDGYAGFSIRLEHVHLDPSIGTMNARVTAGEKIATVWNSQNFDVSVYYHYFRGDELFSYFEVLPDSLFAAWQAEGAANPAEFVFTREYRDAHPLACDHSRALTPNFLDPAGNVTENWNPENFVQLKPNYDPSGK